ncbi:MAG: transketolase [bacterium]|nr:transketolase [bacterium]
MMHLHDEEEKRLEELAQQVRELTIESLIQAGSGHTAGPLALADFFVYLYHFALRHDPKNPDWNERDMFVLSNGHVCPGLYPALALAGYFPVEELMTLRKMGARLQGHPHREYLPGIETSSGPLGSGLSQAVGMALAIRMDEGRTTDRFVYCLTGDGELDEGQNWEAIMLGAKERLHNLVAFVDRNNIQIDGYTEDIMPLESLRDKWEAFGWHVQEIDGHNFQAMHEALGEAKAVFEKPSVIILHTIPGKGLRMAERRPEWHGNPPGKGPEDVYTKKEQPDRMLADIRTLGGQIKSEHE